MSFAWPHLLFLILLPCGLLLWELFQRVKNGTTFHPKILEAEAGRNQLHLRNAGVARQRKPRVWLWLGLMCAVVAVARPQWGRMEEPVFDQSREILIAVDLSRSMLAEDIKPSRLARAKLLISSLLEKLEGERVGLIVFSGTAFLQSPLSADYEILNEFLPALDPGYLPEGGTNYRALLDTTLEAFTSSAAADRFLIVLSDGEATDDNWKDDLEQLQKKNIRAICLGIGTTAGAMIPDGTGAFVKDDRGAVVLSKLQNNTLQELAKSTHGVYRDASGWLDLAAILKETVEAGRKGDFVEKNNVRLVERYQWALAPALLCLLLSFWLEFPVRPRPRDLKIMSAKTTAALLALGLFLSIGAHSLEAAAQLENKAELSPLGKIVSRLSVQNAATGRDWAELARETVTWGQKLKTEQHPVPEGPVRDALRAVDVGSKLDAKTADWAQLRSELEALLQKPEQPPQSQDKKDEQKPQDEKQQQDQQSKQDSQQNQQPQDQQKQDQQKQNQPSGDSPENQSDSGQPQDQQSKPDEQKSEQKKQGQSAFGDMKDQAAPPPQPEKMQQVGGTQEKKEGSPKDTDPALAMPLQKLQKIRDKDSPAKLFQLMEGKPEKPAANQGKNW